MNTVDVAKAILVWLLLHARCNTLEIKYCEIDNECELNCPYNSLANVFFWKHGEKTIFDGKSPETKYQHQYKFIEKGRRLIIQKTAASDNGTYTCEATFTGSLQSHNIMVLLLDITVQRADKVGQIHATAGEALTLECRANVESNTANMTLQWLGKDNLQARKMRSANIAKYNFTANKKHQLQNYTCRLYILGSTRPLERSVQLNISYPPDVSIVDYHNGTLQCNASGFPDKYLYDVWEHRSLFGQHIRYLNGTTDGCINVSSNGSNPSYQNNGIYKCFATNGVHDPNKEMYQYGEQRVIFEEKPVYVTESHQTIYGNVGESVILSVTFFSIPDLTEVYWLKSAGLKVVNSEKYYQINNNFNISLKIYESTITIEGYNSSLAIDDIQKGDECHYTVVVINPRGETRCTVQLVLNDAKPFTIPVVVGSVVAVAILLVVMCIIFWKCKKASKPDTTCDEDRYEKTECKKKSKPEDDYEEVVFSLTSEGKRFHIVSTDNLL